MYKLKRFDERIHETEVIEEFYWNLQTFYNLKMWHRKINL